MNDGKRYATIVVLVFVVLASVHLTVRWLCPPPPTMPPAVSGKRLEYIDRETLELITRTRGEWKSGDRQDGCAENPNTGAYTMVPAVICPHCKGKAPYPVFELCRGEDVGGYTCPRCGMAFSPFTAKMGR